MKYILDSSGYVENASCNPISCDDKVSQEYTGTIPSGYDSLDDWILNANIRAYKITNGNLVYDAARDEALQAEWAKTGRIEDYSTEEQIIGTWIDGKPLYRKVLDLGNLPNAATGIYETGLTITSTIVNVDLRGVSSNYEYIPIPRVTGTNSYINYYVTKYPTDNTLRLYIIPTMDASRFRGYATIEYTKTTD
jgi:hypothetical protein